MSRDFAIVFTGTQAGMTAFQKKVVAKIFARRDGRLFHGCCIGADREANDLWVGIKDSHYGISGYPSNVPGKRAFCLTGINHPPAPPLERNHRMIDDALELGNPMLVAAPKGMEEELRSGTWATVRYARKRGVPVFTAWPDGSWSWDALEEVANSSSGGPTEGHPK